MDALTGAFKALGALMPLVVMIFKEYFSAEARAREAGRVFTMNQTTLKQIVDAAISKTIANLPTESAGQGAAWDAVDNEINKP